ncbi:hypothetical protein H5410_052248 [Solanum commersonii]|uniref:Uncharacterized protein n=1 Tax=Solanum commersonii TaxID=4109 RepID=A0A9J5X2G2_SOLCO|nr:hypothetical protein H5410_052248 [Solanum commersonii]
MASMVLDRFSGCNPTGWLFRAEQYFTYLGFSEKEWLTLAPFYLDGDAYDWFQCALDMMRKLDENYSYILCKLDNVQRALSACSQSLVADHVLLDVDSSCDDKGDPALSFDESSHVFEDLVALGSDTV